MTQQLREDLKLLINKFVSQRRESETCIDKIVELFEETQLKNGEPKMAPDTRNWNIFDRAPHPASSNSLSQQRRASTYNEWGLVNNTDTVLYDNRDIE